MLVKVPYGFSHVAFASKHKMVTAIINCRERKDNCGSCGRLSNGKNGLQKEVGRNIKTTG